MTPPVFGQSAQRSEFLTYDVETLLNWYREETPVSGYLPYTELACFLDDPAGLTVEKMMESFRLTNGQDSAYDAFVNQNRVDRRDSEAVRLENYNAPERRLVVRKCRYSDGLKSNYALDWQGKLRAALAQDYGRALPPLNESRLSNALGLAVVAWYRTKQGDLLPYLPKRAGSRQAVFPGGMFHCTASGEAEWNTEATTFEALFTDHIRKELYEEVGLERADLDWIIPVALCREFLRGGKPQLFFVGLANVGAEQLAARRKAAIERQISAGRQEVLDEVLQIESPEQLYSDLAKYGTIESFVNMYYAQRCIYDPRQKTD